MLVEVCANSLESALNAEKAGADRIELCSELGVGGVTPSFGLISLVKQKLSIPIHVLIRPRSGHFTYSQSEFQVLLKDIEMCKEAQVDGIVSGVLKADASLDIERTKQIVKAAKPLHFTFHRAFDWVANQKHVLKQLENLGVDSVLTSGAQVTAEQGMQQLKELYDLAGNITIMPGGGVNAINIEGFKKVGFRAIHLSGTSFVNKVALNQKIAMNSQKHLVEDEIAVTNEEIIRQIVQRV